MVEFALVAHAEMDAVEADLMPIVTGGGCLKLTCVEVGAWPVLIHHYRMIWPLQAADMGG